MVSALILTKRGASGKPGGALAVVRRSWVASPPTPAHLNAPRLAMGNTSHHLPQPPSRDATDELLPAVTDAAFW